MLFTVGYHNIRRKELKNTIDEMKAALVDIRYIPFSINPFWTQDQLQEVFKSDYFHIKQLGNVNYKIRDSYKILDIEAGIEILSSILEKYKNVFLMCSCKDLNTCHRYLVAEAIKKKLKIGYKEFDIDT